jgi:hypothetical protein
MPNPDNEPQIPKNQSVINDARTGMVARDWYRFFLNLLNKVNEGGGGGNGTGTVTSVNVSGGSTGLTTSGGPITTAGTISLAGTLDVNNGGTGAVTAAAALTNLGAYPASNPSGFTSNTGTVTSIGISAPSLFTVSGSPVTTTGTLNLTYSGTALPIANGGTNGTTALDARSNLGAAASGANTDITSIALTTGTITTTPTNNTDIVNKQYADAIASGIHFHEAVALATTAALPANTYNNGTSGVGATLTANANGALSVDSTLTVVAERILVKNEAAGANNGVYTVTQVGSAGTPYILTRATDFDSVGTGVDQIDEGDFFLVTSGVANVNTAWVQQTPPPITIGTTAIVFQQFAAPITYTAGTGLSESPSYTFNIANIGTAGTYGSASVVPVLTTNAQGQVTSVTNTTIAISGSAVTGNISGSAGSVANALTIGTGLGGTSYDGSAAVTITNTGVTSLTGTASQVTVSGSTGSVTLSLPSPINVDTSGNAGSVTNGVYTNGSYVDPTWIASLSGSKITGNIPGNAANVVGVVAIANGGTGQTTANPAFNALAPTTTKGDLIVNNGTANVRQAVGTDAYVLTADSTTASGVKWAAATGGLTISNDTTTATNLYPTFAAATAGTMSTIYTSNANYLYKPSTGELTSPEVVASNGIFVNSQTIANNYTIAAGTSGLSAGPVTVNTGRSVTVATGSRWVVV